MTVSLLDDGRSAARIATALYLDDERPECVPAKADAAIQQAFLDATLRPPIRAAGTEARPYSVDGCHPSHTGRVPSTAGSGAARPCAEVQPRPYLARHHPRIDSDGALA